LKRNNKSSVFKEIPFGNLKLRKEKSKGKVWLGGKKIKEKRKKKKEKRKKWSY